MIRRAAAPHPGFTRITDYAVVDFTKPVPIGDPA